MIWSGSPRCFRVIRRCNRPRLGHDHAHRVTFHRANGSLRPVGCSAERGQSAPCDNADDPIGLDLVLEGFRVDRRMTESLDQVAKEGTSHLVDLLFGTDANLGNPGAEIVVAEDPGETDKCAFIAVSEKSEHAWWK